MMEKNNWKARFVYPSRKSCPAVIARVEGNGTRECRRGLQCGGAINFQWMRGKINIARVSSIFPTRWQENVFKGLLLGPQQNLPHPPLKRGSLPSIYLRRTWGRCSSVPRLSLCVIPLQSVPFSEKPPSGFYEIMALLVHSRRWRTVLFRLCASRYYLIA